MVLLACNKDDKSQPDPTPNNKYNVYVCGGTSLFPAKIKLWRNGAATVISTNPTSISTGIYVDGNNVYISGSRYDSSASSRRAFYWLNGQEINLIGNTFTSSDRATSIASESGNIYVGGEFGVWKNGFFTNQGYIKDVAIANGLFYSCGESFVSYKAAYWVGQTEYPLSNFFSGALGLFVSGSDVYVAGYEVDPSNNRSRAVYWLNGTKVVLTPAGTEGSAKAIFVLGNDVYVLGNYISASYGGFVPALWKNGQETNFFINNLDAFAEKLFVIDGDVFVVGTTYDSISDLTRATLWQNGTPTYLSNDGVDEEATDIFVTK